MNKHETSDLYYAAFLLAISVPFVETKRIGNRVYFIFEHVEGLNDIYKSYFNGKAQVNAVAFTNAIRQMKTITHMSK